MTFRQEDPFAINLLIQSADQLLTDVAKATNEELRIDWSLYIKDEYLEQFYALRRETTNYLKHARGDFKKALGVRNIVQENVMNLFLAVMNYSSIYGGWTDHMHALFVFAKVLWPKIVHAPPTADAAFHKGIEDLGHSTPQAFAAILFSPEFKMFPRLPKEIADDLVDTKEFYRTPIRRLRTNRGR
jgi:hypothetical protein